ncbi:MAG TPA: hypothetical protein VJ890_21075 [Vineibacter sp.]|nr:hypothetical protein [Vineibacter sp.]
MITMAPTIVGSLGRAWLADLAVMRNRLEIESDRDGTLTSWVIEVPWANPVWHSYALTLIHLRPIDGLRTKFYLAGATHELWLYAMDPDAPRDDIVNGRLDSLSRFWLEPKNFAAQFIETDDAAALQRVRAAVMKICEGKLSPDTDYIRHWMHLFGDNMIKDMARAGETRLAIFDAGDTAVEIVIPAKPGPQDRH